VSEELPIWSFIAGGAVVGLCLLAMIIFIIVKLRKKPSKGI
jgi:hypothetical protein